MEVAARTVDLRRQFRSVGSAFNIRKAGPDVRLVRRLVLREPHVAIDPERRAYRVGGERDAGGSEALVEGDAEGLERLLQQPLVVCLSWLEPGAVVVLGKLSEELDGLGPETF